MRKRQRASGTEIDWQRLHADLAQAGATMREALTPSSERAALVLKARARKLAQPLLEARPSAQLELLTFRLADERYAIETCHVQEVVRSAGVTPVPGMPDIVAGVTNLRGEILVVFDIRSLFGLAPVDGTDASRILVCGDSEPDLGIVADAVTGVICLPEVRLQPRPSTERAANDRLIRGIANEALVMLDGAALLSDQRLFIDQRRQ